MVVKALFPEDTPTVTVARTREDGYQVMRQFLLASGATEADAPIGIQHGPCGGPGDPRELSDGFYNIAVFGGFAAVADQHTVFTRMYEHARRSGFRVEAYENPPSPPPDTPADTSAAPIGGWRLNGTVPGGHGFGFSIFTVRPQNHVAVWVTSSCRVTPDPNEDDGVYTLPSLLPNVPPTAPLWTAPPSPSTPPPSRPAGPADPPRTDTQALARIRDQLG